MSDQGSGGFADLLKRAMEAKSQLERIQQETARCTAEGDAGGGAVRVVANGAGEVVSITMEASLLEAGDAEMIQDLTTAAVNVALRNARQLVSEAVG
ncbi:MAG: YbaB/EbfC family nucleoid-associated protein [Pseudomonadota bacterium]